MTPRLFLSIALATWNGERYLAEQLESLASQERLPDELVVSDDVSDDATCDMVRNFSLRAPFPVRLQINNERLGSTRNFEAAMRACHGDIIFLCDQDDVWYPDKIRRMEECFLQNPQTGLVFTDADVVDQNLDSMDLRLWKSAKFDLQAQMTIARDPYGVLLRYPAVTGATMAFRSAFRDLVLPVPDIWVHDAWIALLIGAKSSLVPLSLPLIGYRQHGANQIGISRPGKNRNKSCREIYGPQIACFELVRMQLLALSGQTPDIDDAIRRIDGKLTFLRTCAALPDARWRRLPGALGEFLALRYYRYSRGARTFFKDLWRVPDTRSSGKS
jgi:glycosyltransferase involved in cell wall biosynthesis